MGRPLFDSAFVGSSCTTSQCSARRPSTIRRMSTTIRVGLPPPLKRPCTMTWSPSATASELSYRRVRPRTNENSPSRPGAIPALCWMYVGKKYFAAASKSLRLKSASNASRTSALFLVSCSRSRAIAPSVEATSLSLAPLVREARAGGDHLQDPLRRSQQRHRSPLRGSVSVLRDHIASVLRKRVVGIAIQPPLLALRGGDDGMPARARVLRGVAVGRAVATQRSATLLAGAQMDPLRAHLHALGALPLFRVPHRCDRADVGAGSVGAHCPPPYC